jgi:hypothetical protein
VTAAGDNQKLSTSALAKALALPAQQLFVTLRDYGWIRKVDDGWLLTPKGEFEGGEYVHSRRYGRYIVWPETLLEHALLRGLEGNRFLTAAQIARKYGIHARSVRRLLGELGLLRRDFNGWALTRRGEQLGGIDIEGEGDDAVHWPEALLENELVAAQLEYGRQLHAAGGEQQPDLLEPVNEFRGLDGHCVHTRGEWLICDWLYLAGIAHACGRQLPLADAPGQRADFWLPEAQLYIECTGDERDGTALGASLERLDLYRRLQWPFIEVHAEQLIELDDYLTLQLQQLGVRVL